jgi:hypothetical protein
MVVYTPMEFMGCGTMDSHPSIYAVYTPTEFMGCGTMGSRPSYYVSLYSGGVYAITIDREPTRWWGFIWFNYLETLHLSLRRRLR